MKLYATVTSERASKGQGGNDYLKIQILAGSERKILANLEINQFHGNIAEYNLYCNDEIVASLQDRKCPCSNCRGRDTKGNKQKGKDTRPYSNDDFEN